ncbi:hypothetical protein BVRB_5g106040 [Beta vulgaris subsp. vulgaris]|nr:hypothetical protein BVRB_5g106040 [Beta vulgaris subsp. vulgaris]
MSNCNPLTTFIDLLYNRICDSYIGGFYRYPPKKEIPRHQN